MTEAIYRKEGSRTFYKVHGMTTTIRVVNKFRNSTIMISDESLIRPDEFDPQFKEITAQEFEEALRIAKERINNETI